jgi:hypothetical protein
MTTHNRRLYHLKFAIEKSIRYHQRRQAHYEHLHRVVVFLIIASGSAAFTKVLAPDILGAIAAALGILDLVAGFSLKARDHAVLQKRYTDILAEIKTAPNPSDAQIAQWERRRIEIETEEPKMMYALEAWCDNEVRRAWNVLDQGVAHLGWRHRLLKDWVSFSGTVFELERPAKEAMSGPHQPPKERAAAGSA